MINLVATVYSLYVPPPMHVQCFLYFLLMLLFKLLPAFFCVLQQDHIKTSDCLLSVQ